MQNISSTYFKVEQLLSEIQELVASIQNVYFKELVPLNDDNLLVHRLCMALENIFRAGAKEKYSFTGAKKEFWNFISESLPKEEIIRFINSISDLRTYQGKGRAFIRQALMEKCLADTLQCCIINEKFIKDYFEADSIFQDKTLFGTLINSLYDLNSILFNLPYKGYDLDRSWPSFSRKAFYEKKRTSSQSSLFSLNEEVADPFLILKNHINMLDALLRDWDSGYKPENLLKVYSHPLEVSIDMLMTIHSELVKLKQSYQKLNEDLKKLNNDLNALETEKVFIQSESDFKMNQLQEHNKEIEQNLVLSNNRFILNQSELYELKSKNEMLSEKCKVHEEKFGKSGTADELTKKIADQEEQNKTLKLEISNFTDELKNFTNELNKKNETIAVQEKELLVLRNINAKSELTLEELMRDIKDQIKLQESHINLNDKRECDLKVIIQSLEKKLDEESQNKEYLETLLKEHKLNSEKQLHNMWQVFITEIINLFKADMNMDQIDDVINFHCGEESALKIIKKVRDQFEASKIFKTQAEESALHLKLEQAKLEKNVIDLQQEVLTFQNQVNNLNMEVSMLYKEKKVALENNALLKAETQKNIIDFESLKSKCECEENARRSHEDVLKNEIRILSEEVKSLEFHLSTKEIKYKDILKENESCKVDYERCKVDFEKLVISFENIQNLNSLNSKEISCLQEENKQKFNEILDMKSEIDALKSELKTFYKEKEDIYQLYEKCKKDCDSLSIEKTNGEHQYEEIIQQIKSDTDDMKDQLIKLAKDKEELWEQKNALEITLQTRISNHWIDDKDVEKCMNCSKMFSMANRKHHCRLCGGIFCKMCSNERIQTQFSRKKVRCCQTCVYLFKHKCPLADVAADDISSDTSSIFNLTNVSSSTEEDTDELSPVGGAGGFEELDLTNANSSKIISKNTELISILENDIKQTAIVPVVHQDNDGPSDIMEILIIAGTRCLFPLVAGSIKFELVWEFESSPKDISFGIAYKENELVLDNQVETVIPLSRYCSHQQVVHGRMRIEKPGIYIMIFSNLYSRFLSKNVKYSFRLCPLFTDCKR